MLLFWGCATVAFCAPVVDTFQSNIPTVGQQFITKNIAYAAATHYPATKKISSVAAAAAEPRSLLDFKSSPKERAGGGLVAASIEDFKKKMPSDWEKTIKNYTPLVSSKNTIPKKSLLTAAIVSEKDFPLSASKNLKIYLELENSGIDRGVYAFDTNKIHALQNHWFSAKGRSLVISMMRKFAAEAQPASLHSESLWTAVNLFDRFISKQKLSGAQNDLNVVADACLFIAAKLDDEQITRITSNTQVLDMESTILKSIDWNVPLVSPYVFYHEIQENFKSEQVTGFKAKSMKVFSMYMSEILEDLRFQSFPPSTIAMSAFLSIHHYDAALSANGGRVMWGKVARFLEIESDQKQIKRLKDCFKLLSDLVK